MIPEWANSSLAPESNRNQSGGNSSAFRRRAEANVFRVVAGRGTARGVDFCDLGIRPHSSIDRVDRPTPSEGAGHTFESCRVPPTLPNVSRRDEVTPPQSIISMVYRADRYWDPAPNDGLRHNVLTLQTTAIGSVTDRTCSGPTANRSAQRPVHPPGAPISQRRRASVGKIHPVR